MCMRKRWGSCQREHPGAEILINISSGTPQMIMAQGVLVATSSIPKLRCVQVTTPKRKSNEPPPSITCGPPLTDNWKDQSDPNAKHRNKSVALESHTRKLVLSNLMGLIGEEQYHAAARLAEMNQDYLTDAQQKASRVHGSVSSWRQRKRSSC